MHIKYSLINKTELETNTPFETMPDVLDSVEMRGDTLDNAIQIDIPGTFVGMVSPEQIDLIADILADNGLL